MSENDRADLRSDAQPASVTDAASSGNAHAGGDGRGIGGSPDGEQADGARAETTDRRRDDEPTHSRAAADPDADAGSADTPRGEAHVAEESAREAVESSEQSKTVQSKIKSEAWEWTKAILIAFGLVFVIRYFLFSPFIVEGPSMQPNFHTGEWLIVNKLLYDIREPKRGEVVVFHATADKDFIKRVIALPGETVKVQGDQVYVNGQPLDEPYLREAVEKARKEGGRYNDLNMPETKVPEGTVFVLGDNRSDSTDSRMLGPIPYGKLVGRAEFVYWPLPDIRWIH